MTRKHILIIDDEVNILKCLERMLEDVYHVTTVTGGREALELLATQKVFDLIICDIKMPVCSGADFYLSILKEYPHLKDKIIFMTGSPYGDYVEEFSLNNNPCLRKPFYESEELFQVLENFFNNPPVSDDD